MVNLDIFDTSIFNQIKKNNKKIKIINRYILINSLENIYSYSNNKYFIDKSLENFFI